MQRRNALKSLSRVAPALLAATPTLAAASSAPAQVIGPDAGGYRALNTPTPSAFEGISATGTRVLSSAEDATVAAPIGFGFGFYANSFNSLFISSNALITFGTPNDSFSNVNLRTSASASSLPLIAPMWDDWVTYRSAADAIYHQTRGAPGNRRFVVQWHLVSPFASFFAPDPAGPPIPLFAIELELDKDTFGFTSGALEDITNGLIRVAWDPVLPNFPPDPQAARSPIPATRRPR